MRIYDVAGACAKQPYMSKSVVHNFVMQPEIVESGFGVYCRCMSVIVDINALVTPTAETIGLSQLFQITPSLSNPTYLILNAFDRNEYTSASTQLTGNIGGAGYRFGLSVVDGDARGVGLVFQYQPTTGRYLNDTVGYLDQLTYTSSPSVNDVTDLSLFGTNNLQLADTYAADGFALIQYDQAGYIGSVTVASEPSFVGPVPNQATPNSIASVADGFVGQSWNVNGCWVLACTIAADAGASLPLQSAAIVAGQPNGEWTVAYNGPVQSSGNWQSDVRTGDMVAFITASGTGHITTCVSGAGSSAMLVDNEVVLDSSGRTINVASDNSTNDITIVAPHAASEEWNSVQADSVVIYRLDTPVVSISSDSLDVAGETTQILNSLFSAADPVGKAIVAYQIYSTGSDGVLTVDGTTTGATSASSAATVNSLSDVEFSVGSSGGTEIVDVRASNGTYWGDWAALTLNISSVAQQVVPATPIAETAPVPVTPSAPTPAASPPAATIEPVTPTSMPTPSIEPVTVASAPGASTPSVIAVFRFFDTADGTHFFSASASERDILLASRPDMSFEGVGLSAFGQPEGDSSAEAVYRFFNTSDGTHFFTASTTERDALMAGRSNMTFEGTAFYEDAIQQSGDIPVYRFFDSLHGTHLYTEDAAERASILATRPDLTPEGIAFYAPS